MIPRANKLMPAQVNARRAFCRPGGRGAGGIIGGTGGKGDTRKPPPGMYPAPRYMYHPGNTRPRTHDGRTGGTHPPGDALQEAATGAPAGGRRQGKPGSPPAPPVVPSF